MASNVTKAHSMFMMIGKIVKHVGEKNLRTVEVRCKVLEMDQFLTMYFSKPVTVLADDPHEKCEPGDHVLIKEFKKPIRVGVTHGVKEIVFKLGRHVDPITGYECAGTNYRPGQLPDPHEVLDKYGIQYIPDGSKPRPKVS